MVTAEERAVGLYDRLLAAIGARADEVGRRPLASMWPHVGSAYRPGALYLLGQALQGWDADECNARWRAAEAATAEGQARIIAETRAWHADAVEPIATVLEVGSGQDRRSGAPPRPSSRRSFPTLEAHGWRASPGQPVPGRLVPAR